MNMLSICMIVRDEEENLERCLLSLERLSEKIASELIIVDTGSTDNTIEIAHKYTEKVFIHPWENDFAAMRNKSIGYAKGNWVLVIDADEQLANPEGIISCLKDKKITAEYNALLLSVKDFPKKSDSSIFFEYLLPRVFKNDGKFKFEGSVHEQPIYSEPSYVVNGECLYHYGYNSEDKGLIEKKTLRMSSMLLEKLKDNPKDIYYLYQLSATYRMGKMYIEGLEYIEKAFNLIPNNEWDNYSYVVKHYVLMLRDLDREDEILKVEEMLKEKMTFGIDLAYMIAEIFYKYKKYHQAKKYYNYYLDRIKLHEEGQLIKENMTESIITLRYKDSVIIKLLKVLFANKDFNGVLECFGKLPETLYNEELLGCATESILELELANQFEELVTLLSGGSVAMKESVIQKVEAYGDKHPQYAIDKYQNCVKRLNPMYEILLLARDLYKKGQNVSTSELIQFYKGTLNTNSVFYSDFLYFAMKNGANIFEVLIDFSNEEIERTAVYLVDKYKELKELSLLRISENRVYEAMRPIMCLEWIFLDHEKGPEKDNRLGFDLLLNKIEWLYRVYLKEVVDISPELLPGRDKLFGCLNLMIQKKLPSCKVESLIANENNLTWVYLYKLSLENGEALLEEIEHIKKTVNLDVG